MAYFNHSFTKIFLGIGETKGSNPKTNKGLILDAGVPMGAADPAAVALSNLTPGYFGIFDPKTYLSLNPEASIADSCCPIMIAGSSILSNDKIGPFHGGYKETNKSKVINPKYVQAAYRVNSCVPQQSIVSIGNTPQTVAGPTEPDNFQSGTGANSCQKDFLCGETYYLRIDIKGSPALRALNHNAYQTLSAYTGCCSGPTPEAVDPTLVYIEWAKALVINNYLKPFVLPVVFDTTGAPWYAPGTTVDPIDPTITVLPGQWWTNYISPAGPYAGLNAGMRLIGAYVETKFLNCTFQITDFFEKEPVRIYASLVDYNGDPCTFEGLCVYNDCRGLQGMGFGEQVVRDLILSQSYLQNFFHSDLRIREITQGNQMLDAGGLSRNALYTRYFILHSVPRFNNPTGVFDNDRYMLEIIVNEADPENPVGISQFDIFLTEWLKACANCVPFETQLCGDCGEIQPDDALVS